MVILLALFASACANSRPSVDEWVPKWERAMALIPLEAELGVPPDEKLCESVLVELRKVSVDLSLTPDETLDTAVDAWIRVAEQAMFECPPEEGDIASMEAAYTELQQLQDEVGVLIASQR